MAESTTAPPAIVINEGSRPTNTNIKMPKINSETILAGAAVVGAALIGWHVYTHPEVIKQITSLVSPTTPAKVAPVVPASGTVLNTPPTGAVPTVPVSPIVTFADDPTKPPLSTPVPSNTNVAYAFQGYAYDDDGLLKKLIMEDSTSNEYE
jgi:hypothetical protein